MDEMSGVKAVEDVSGLAMITVQNAQCKYQLGMSEDPVTHHQCLCPAWQMTHQTQGEPTRAVFVQPHTYTC